MKSKVVASIGNSVGIESFEKLVNDYFYSKHWKVENHIDGWKAFNPVLGKELSENGYFIKETNGRYQIKKYIK